MDYETPQDIEVVR